MRRIRLRHLAFDRIALESGGAGDLQGDDVALVHGAGADRARELNRHRRSLRRGGRGRDGGDERGHTRRQDDRAGAMVAVARRGARARYISGE